MTAADLADALEPCPWCQTAVTPEKLNESPTVWGIVCMTGQHDGTHLASVHGATEAEAIAIWNTRAPAGHHGGELAGEFERLAKAAHAFLTSAPGSSSDDLDAFESFCFNHRAEISNALSGKVKP